MHLTDVAVAKDEVRLQYGHQWVNRPTSHIRLVDDTGGPTPTPLANGAPPSGTPTGDAPTTDNARTGVDADAPPTAWPGAPPSAVTTGASETLEV